ncbi:hypothetical protein AMTR_s00044p00080750 [Amborella trichopoda]|uniref:Cysteine protease n=1 Tax=Amborella trichopoda TaxID=13333 RepID=U5D4F5_AMBTC|nr:hypothetical protein AMTR_s00044p00080750 [Amborella trichopoda]
MSMLIMHPFDPEYVEILRLFGDSEASALSIHNLLKYGNGYGLAAGSWLGVRTVCYVSYLGNSCPYMKGADPSWTSKRILAHGPVGVCPTYPA